MLMLESLTSMIRIRSVKLSASGFLIFLSCNWASIPLFSQTLFSRNHPAILSRLFLLLASCHLLREMLKVDAGCAFYCFATVFSSLQVLRNLQIRKADAVCGDTSTALVTRFTRFDDVKISHESRLRKYQWCHDLSICKLVGEARRFRSRASCMYHTPVFAIDFAIERLLFSCLVPA